MGLWMERYVLCSVGGNDSRNPRRFDLGSTDCLRGRSRTPALIVGARGWVDPPRTSRAVPTYEDADALYNSSTGLVVAGGVLGVATLGYAIFALPDDGGSGVPRGRGFLRAEVPPPG
jgi:hypothetical protein